MQTITTNEIRPAEFWPVINLGQLHRFLLSHAFYPLVFATMLCGAFLITRACFMGYLGYRFLVWNLFLAWIPYLLSLVALQLHRTRPDARVRIAAVWTAWLFMFPNAPYILTDLVHWRGGREMPWWFDLGLLLMFGLAGCFLAVVSLRIMHDLAARAVGRMGGWIFVVLLAGLTGFGIDLGRFERWNSWDLLTRPHHILGQIINGLADPLSHTRTIGVTFMFGAMVLVTYVMFVSTSAPALVTPLPPTLGPLPAARKIQRG